MYLSDQARFEKLSPCPRLFIISQYVKENKMDDIYNKGQYSFDALYNLCNYSSSIEALIFF